MNSSQVLHIGRRLAMLALAMLALLRTERIAVAAERPNVLLVVCDQWRAQAFGFAGDPNVHTPTLDRFETQCVHCVNAVSGTPVCTPMRATLLTGQRPLTHGLFLNDAPLDPAINSLGKMFQTAGYDTACIGKWHIDGHGRSEFIPRERRQGFEYWKVQECTHAYNRSFYFADGPDRQQWDGYDAAAQTADAVQYIKNHAQAAKPFLMYLSWGPPHNPYDSAPARYKEMYRPENMRLQRNVPPEMEKKIRSDLAGYYAHCTALDDCFSQLLQALQETGQDRRTIVVFTADHGDMLGSHGMQRKQCPYEESVRVPSLWRVPENLGIKPQHLTAAINTEDILPTLLSLTGQAIPQSVEGRDFTNCFRGAADPNGGATVVRCVVPFSEYSPKVGGREYRAVHTTRYTYARDLNGPWLLFDNQRDALQENNLIGKPEFAALQAELETLLKEKLREQHDEFLPAADYIKKWHYRVSADGAIQFKP